MRHYCTYFDANYLTRGLALIDSLRRHDGDIRMAVLCLDDTSFALLRQLAIPGVLPVSLADLEAADPALITARNNRSRLEYIWTLTPALILHAQSAVFPGEMMTYVDADLYFYSSPQPIFDEFEEGHVSIIPHRFAHDAERQTAMHGRYNVGMMSFANTEPAHRVLKWWREQCLGECCGTPQNGKFGDQKYLDDWLERFEGIVEIRHPGANVGPWNIRRHRITKTNGHLSADGQPLIFYHFHKFEIFGRQLYRCTSREVSRANLRLIYTPYLVALQIAQARVEKICPAFRRGQIRPTLRVAWETLRYRRFRFIYQASGSESSS